MSDSAEDRRGRAGHASAVEPWTGAGRPELEARCDLARGDGDVGVFRVDLISGELYWDDVVRGFYGVPPGQRVTLELALEAVHADDRAAVRRKLEQIAAGLHHHFEHSYRVLDHSIRHLHVSGRTLFDEAGAAVGIVGSVRSLGLGESLPA